MKIESRLIASYAVRLVFIGFAAWVALAPSALPGAHDVTKIALAALLVGFSVLVGELSRLRLQFELLVQALRTVTGRPDRPGNEREAVSILIRALGSRDADTREKAHRNLVRLTGQDLPADRAAWETWWKDSAESRKTGA